MRERHPKSSEEASKVAHDYLQARKEEVESRKIKKDGDKRQASGDGRKFSKQCTRCGKPGHVAE